MAFSPSSHRPNRAGSRSAPDRQLSKEGRRLLLFLLLRQRDIQQTSGGSVTLMNQGIPWRPAHAADLLGVLPSSVARTLNSLERRRLVFCWGTGEGRGRRVSHIKLSYAAERIAEHEERYGMSEGQRSRQIAKEYREKQEAL